MKILLSSFSDAVKSKKLKESIEKRREILLGAASSGNNDNSITFIEAWAPGIHSEVSHVLIPKELQHKRTLKIVWAAAFRKPIISDEAFFDSDSPKAPDSWKDALQNAEPLHQVEEFRAPQSLHPIMESGAQVRRFFHHFRKRHKEHAPKFKMPLLMLKEICEHALNMEVLDDFHAGHGFTTRKPTIISPSTLDEPNPDLPDPVDLLIIPTATESWQSSFVLRQYERHDIVRTCHRACITEKYLFDLIMGKQTQMNDMNTQIPYLNPPYMVKLMKKLNAEKSLKKKKSSKKRKRKESLSNGHSKKKKSKVAPKKKKSKKNATPNTLEENQKDDGQDDSNPSREPELDAKPSNDTSTKGGDSDKLPNGNETHGDDHSATEKANSDEEGSTDATQNAATPSSPLMDDGDETSDDDRDARAERSKKNGMRQVSDAFSPVLGLSKDRNKMHKMIDETLFGDDSSSDGDEMNNTSH